MLANGGGRNNLSNRSVYVRLRITPPAFSLFCFDIRIVKCVSYLSYQTFVFRVKNSFAMIIFTHFLLPLLVHFCDCRGDSKLIFFNNPITASRMRRLNSYLFSLSINYSEDVKMSTIVLCEPSRWTW